MENSSPQSPTPTRQVMNWAEVKEELTRAVKYPKEPKQKYSKGSRRKDRLKREQQKDWKGGVDEGPEWMELVS
jgi:hypothetical protein